MQMMDGRPFLKALKIKRQEVMTNLGATYFLTKSNSLAY